MTALEETIKELDRARALALTGNDEDKVRFAKLLLAAWHTVHYALTELQRQRVV